MLLPLQCARNNPHYTQGDAVGYMLLPLRDVWPIITTSISVQKKRLSANIAESLNHCGTSWS